MHRALYIPEIAEEIAEACLWGNYDLESNLQDGEGRAALFALARTCHALAEPALDALWFYQHGLVNLIRTMPSDIWSEEETRNPSTGCATTLQQWSTTQLSFTKSPSASDWARFDYYARRVHVFHYDEALRWADVAPNVYRALSIHAALQLFPLFPALASLRWEADVFFPYVSLFLGPSLSALIMSTVGAEAELVKIATALPASCRHLRKLEVYLGSSSTMPPPSLACWSEFKDVRGFSTDVIRTSDPVEWLLPLALLPNLRNLSLSVFNSSPRAPPMDSPVSFPSLTRLALFTDSIPQCIPIFDSCHFPALRDLTINAYGGVTSGMQDLSSALARSIHPTSLQSFSVYDYSNRLAGNPASINLAALSGLLHFANMQHVRLDVRYTVHVTDRSLEAFSRAWPRLESFELNWVGHCGYEGRLCRPLPTLRGLVDFVANCSALRALSIVIDASVTEVQGSSLARFFGHPIVGYLGAIGRVLSTSSPGMIKAAEATSVRNTSGLLQVKIGRHLCTFHDTVFHCPIYAVLFSYD